MSNRFEGSFQGQWEQINRRLAREDRAQAAQARPTEPKKAKGSTPPAKSWDEAGRRFRRSLAESKVERELTREVEKESAAKMEKIRQDGEARKARLIASLEKTLPGTEKERRQAIEQMVLEVEAETRNKLMAEAKAQLAVEEEATARKEQEERAALADKKAKLPAKAAAQVHKEEQEQEAKEREYARRVREARAGGLSTSLAHVAAGMGIDGKG